MGWLGWLRDFFFGPPRRPPGSAAPRPAPSSGRLQSLGPADPRRGSSVDASASSSSSTGRAAGPSASTRRRDDLAALDVAQFAPLDDAAVRAAADAQGGRLGSPWFGRQDLIPPASDPRTLLIDRAMVGHGFLAPEDLVDIHQIGARMDELRPDLALAVAEADRAVARTAEEKAALKAEKKAAAAERRRARAEQVVHRRATDIVFLGRGVSKGLAERVADRARLEAAGLPVLAEPADVAAALGLSVSKLRWLAYHSAASSRTHYVSFAVPKKGGGERVLSAPHREMAAAQEWILRNILDRVPVHAAAHGFVRGRSTVTGARRHVAAGAVLTVDLKDFFPTITFRRVKGLFQQLGYSPAAATILALLCTEAPRRPVDYAGERLFVATGPRALPQGACTSPALSNLVVRRMDSRLQGLCAKLGWTYTRYADDLTFSASGESMATLGYLMARVRHIAQHEGFVLHPDKTRVRRSHRRQAVTGIVVNQKTSIPRETIRRLRSILHHARHEGLAAQNRENRPNFEGWLRGMLAYVRMVNPAQGERLQRDYDALATGGSH